MAQTSSNASSPVTSVGTRTRALRMLTSGEHETERNWGQMHGVTASRKDTVENDRPQYPP
eukprot:10687973-Lingulodinium_polyedra.AAC.1